MNKRINVLVVYIVVMRYSCICNYGCCSYVYSVEICWYNNYMLYTNTDLTCEKVILIAVSGTV